MKSKHTLLFKCQMKQALFYTSWVDENIGRRRIFLLFTAARTLRTISFIEGLQVLVTALIDTIRNSVLNVVILLTMLMAFFAVVGYYIFGYEEETGDKKNWGTLSTAMLTLFTFVTVSFCTDVFNVFFFNLSYFLNIISCEGCYMTVVIEC